MRPKHTPIDVHDLVNVNQSAEETGDGLTRMAQISEFYKTFDTEGVLSNRKIDSQEQDIAIKKELQQLEQEYKEKTKTPDPQQDSADGWPEWDDTHAAYGYEVLFGNSDDRYDPHDPFIGIPGQGGIKWSEGMDIIDNAFPDYEPSVAGDPSESFDVINQAFDEYVPQTGSKEDDAFPLTAGDKQGPTDRVQPEANESEQGEYLPTPGRCASPTSSEGSYYKPTKPEQLPVDEDGPYPPTPGAPSDMNNEDSADITMNNATPAEASTAPLPVPELHIGIVAMDTDVDMDKEGHVEPETTVGAELTEEEIDNVAAGKASSGINAEPQDVVMEEGGVLAINNTDKPQLEQSQDNQHNKNVQSSRHLLPPFPYSRDARIPAAKPSAPLNSLTDPPSTKGKLSNKKSTNKDSASGNEQGRAVKAEKLPKLPIITSRKDSLAIEKPDHDSTPTTPPRHKEQLQSKVATYPIVAPSPLKLLQKSVKMGRKESFSKGQDSADDTPKSKGEGSKSGNTGNIAKPDEELLDDFVYKPQEEVNKILAPELKRLIRGVESLRKYHNGLNKKQMGNRYMIWQQEMRALQEERAAEQAEEEDEEEEQVVAGAEEEDGDLDAEGEEDDDLMDQDSPVTGRVTPGPPLKSPFTGQPRSAKQTPLMKKFTEAAKASTGSPIGLRHAGRSKTLFEAQDGDGGEEDDNEPEVYKKFLKDAAKRSRRSVSPPTTYKE